MLLDSKFNYVKGIKGFKERDSYLECEGLPKGKYFIYVEMEWADQQFEFCVNAYGPGHSIIDFECSDKHDLKKLLLTAFKSKVKSKLGEIKSSNMEEKGAPNI